MTTYHTHRHDRGRRHATVSRGHVSSAADWRCSGCGCLLGVRRDGRLQVRLARGHQYLVSLPSQATCRGCGTLNALER